MFLDFPLPYHKYLQTIKNDRTIYDSLPQDLNTVSRYSGNDGNFREMEDMRVRRSDRNSWYIDFGIVADCCYKACSYSTLISYCSSYQ